jgi:hypothetical protein
MKNLLLVLILLITITGFAQKQNPPQILWKSIKTENFKVIFPDEIEAEAQRITNTLEWVYKFDTKTLDVKPKPVSIVLYNHSTTSNAYAGLAPRRMGWYLRPPQAVSNLGSMDWAQLLAIHEYRHIVQYAKNKKHFTKFMTYLFGDMGQIMTRWSIPDWFFEGDAIVLETSLTKGGRGRIPAFSMPIRTYSVEKERFTYDQAYLGSYKRYYPSHYHLGYPLTAFGRINYGADIWDKVLERTAKFSFWPYAFGTSVKHYTGLNMKKFYNKAMLEYDSIWAKQLKNVYLTDALIKNTQAKRSWTNYFNPQYDDKGNIIVGKESLAKIAAFYRISPGGKEEKIKDTDAEIFNYSNERISWARTIPDIRWGEQSFTDIVVLNLKTKKERYITKKGKYMSPVVSPDGSKIAAVKFGNNQKSYLVILHSGSGKELAKYQVGNNDYIRTPVWSSDGSFVAFTHAKYKGPAISILKVQNGEIFNVKPYSYENIGRPVFYKDFLIYNSNFSGIGNIYAINIFTQESYLITSRKFGAYNASVSEKKDKMLFQDYTKEGFDIAEMDLQPENWININRVKNNDPKYYKPLIGQEAGKNIYETEIPSKEYPVSAKKYRSGLKFHSWGVYPLINVLDVSVMADNYLNTLSLTAGYLYNINEQTHGAYMGISFAKYFPVLSLVSAYNQKNRTYKFSDGTSEYLAWNQYSVNAGVSLPFNISRGIYYTKFTLSAGANYTFIDDKPFRTLGETYGGNFTPLYGGISFSNIKRYAIRDFNPQWGQTVAVNYSKIMNYDDYEGYLFSARSGFYFPGILPNNSLKLGASYEQQLEFDPNDYNNSYYFSSRMSFPRGYDSEVLDKVYKLTVDYKFPIWYSDISIGPIAYVKRIRGGVFYDYAQGSFGTESREYQSVGGSLIFEVNIFRIRYPLEIGAQYAYKISDGGYKISLLISGLPI